MTDFVLTSTLMVAVMGIFACSEDPPVDPKVYATPNHFDSESIIGDGFEGVIVPATIFRRQMRGAGAWTPTASDVRAFERSDCPQYWIDECDDRARRSGRATYVANQYVRHYMGSTFPAESRVMIVYFMCEPPDDWRSRLVSVRDGGCCYLHAFYNVDKNECVPIERVPR